MSIVIHGMKMPKAGERRIAILIGSDGIADVYNFCGTHLGKYICECSAIELPPHGRLGDLDATLEEAKRISGPMTGDGWDNWGVYALIKRQPTIIPAEGGDAQ